MVQPALALSELSREERPRVDITAAILALAGVIALLRASGGQGPPVVNRNLEYRFACDSALRFLVQRSILRCKCSG